MKQANEALKRHIKKLNKKINYLNKQIELKNDFIKELEEIEDNRLIIELRHIKDNEIEDFWKRCEFEEDSIKYTITFTRRLEDNEIKSEL